MTTYMGIDEAGYGPLLGPYTLGAVQADLPSLVDVFDSEEDELAKFLRLGCSVYEPSKQLIVIDDSKELHKGKKLRRVEAAALLVLIMDGSEMPSNALELITRFGDVTEPLDEYKWYKDTLHRISLPLEANQNQIMKARDAISCSMSKQGVAFVRGRVTVAPVRALNHLFRGKKKGDAVFPLIGERIRSATANAASDCTVRIDKQGARNIYGDLLRPYVQGPITALQEEKRESSYLAESTSRVLVQFALRSDAKHILVTCAGIVAKYFREVLMVAQNKWFQEQGAKFRGTAGYGLDAKRWISESADFRKVLDVPYGLLLRQK